MSEFKISLRAARINAELTQEQAAKLMGRNKQTIANWESGKTEISFGDVLRLCQVYNVPVEYIRKPDITAKSSSGQSKQHYWITVLHTHNFDTCHQ